jgi:cytochrome c biogenesis protein CcdA
MIVRQDMTYSYPEVITITLAAYTFYKITSSILSIVRYRKYKSPILSASKAIRLVAALVSMISLETAMLTTFGGEMPEEIRDLFIILAGAAVSAVILTMAFYMILHAGREIKRIRNESLKSPNGKGIRTE